MKKKELWMLILLFVSIVSCKYDDSELKESIQTLDERISAMESTVRLLNEDIVSMQNVISSLEKNVYISHVETLADGYILYFTDGTTATIRNGKDGKDGQNGTDGKDGEDGKDGVNGQDGTDGENGRDGKDAPVIGINKEDGIYYWTVTLDGKTNWLEDEAGNRLRVTGVDGNAGITPRLSIDNEGFWQVSYDNGKTYTRVLDISGNPVSALGTKGDKGDKGDPGQDGVPGEDGKPGMDGDSFFKNVADTEDAVILTLSNGTVITIPKAKAFTIWFDQTKNIPVGNTELALPYTITGADNDTFVEAYAVGNVSVRLGEGCLYVKGTGNLEGSKVLVLLCNKEKTITTVLTFVKKEEYQSTGNAENYQTENKEWD